MRTAIGIDPGERSGAAVGLVRWRPSERWSLEWAACWDPRLELGRRAAVVPPGPPEECVGLWWWESTAAEWRAGLVRDRLIMPSVLGCFARRAAASVGVEVPRGGPGVNTSAHASRGAWRAAWEEPEPVDVPYHRWRAFVGAPGTATASQTSATAWRWAIEEVEGVEAVVRLPRKGLRDAVAEACAIAVVAAGGAE